MDVPESPHGSLFPHANKPCSKRYRASDERRLYVWIFISANICNHPFSFARTSWIQRRLQDLNLPVHTDDFRVRAGYLAISVKAAGNTVGGTRTHTDNILSVVPPANWATTAYTRRDSNSHCPFRESDGPEPPACTIRLRVHNSERFRKTPTPGLGPGRHLRDYSRFSKPLPYQLGLRRQKQIVSNIYSITPRAGFEPAYHEWLPVFRTGAPPVERPWQQHSSHDQAAAEWAGLDLNQQCREATDLQSAAIPFRSPTQKP